MHVKGKLRLGVKRKTITAHDKLELVYERALRYFSIMFAKNLETLGYGMV